MTRYTALFSSVLVLACSLAVHTTTAFRSPSVALHRGTTSFTKQTPAALMRPSFLTTPTPSTTSISMSSDETSESSKKDFGFLLDPSTKGGAVFIALAAFVVPVIGYNIAVAGFGMDGIEVGKWIGVGFTVVACLGWAGTYIFRVANKDMTYVRDTSIVPCNTVPCILHSILRLLRTNESTHSITLSLCYIIF
jgi:hypothetical protein